MNPVFLNPYAVFYGTAGLAALMLNLLSHRRWAPLMCASLLLTNWFVTCWIETIMGYDRAPLVIAPADALVAIAILATAIRARCETGYMIFGVFVCGAIWHVLAFLTGIVGNATYYGMGNVLYFISVVIAGAPGAKERLDRWSAGRARIALSLAVGR